ncbi:MAG TPA: cytochrome c maturation protein CcmE [Paracoccus sp. (in: a-proteobacteria)]|nr:cytochrome c maturation protein CcmE [Paracoccus sp. (in: a-proteobacteria)]
MRSLKKKRRIQVLSAAAVALALSAGLIGYGFRDGINLYRSPTQVMTEPPAQGEVFRLGGLVQEGTLQRGQGETVSFAVSDGAEVVPVRFTGVLPDLFAENAGMIGTGRMENGVFVADEILAKHDENYMPKEVADSLKEAGVYQEPSS